MPGGVEVFPFDIEAAMPQNFIPAPSDPENHKEPSRGALRLVEQSDIPIDLLEESEMGQPQDIQRLNFNRRSGTFLLGLNDKKVVSKLLRKPQLERLRDYGFRPKSDLHITVLNYENGQRLIRGLDGDKKRLASIEAEVREVSWKWRPTGKFYPLRSRPRSSTKIVALVDCPGAEEFYRRLEEQLPGLELERHPMHISLLRKPVELRERCDGLVGGVAIGRPLHRLDNLVQAYGS